MDGGSPRSLSSSKYSFRFSEDEDSVDDIEPVAARGEREDSKRPSERSSTLSWSSSSSRPRRGAFLGPSSGFGPLHSWIAQKTASILGDVDVEQVKQAMSDASNWNVLEQFTMGNIATVFASKEAETSQQKSGESGNLSKRSPGQATRPPVMFFYGRVSKHFGTVLVYFTRMPNKDDVFSDHRSRWEQYEDKKVSTRSEDVVDLHNQTSEYAPLSVYREYNYRTLVGSLHPEIISCSAVVLKLLYQPLFMNLDGYMWGQCSLEGISHFRQRLDSYLNFLEDTSGGVVEDKDLPRPSKSTLRVLQDEEQSLSLEQMNELCSLVREWCDHGDISITNAGDRNNNSSDVKVPYFVREQIPTLTAKISLEGPEVELEFWQRRLRRLEALHDQLRQVEKRRVIKGLKRFWSGNSLMKDSTLERTLRRWSDLEVALSEASNGAKENVKYLSILSKYVHPLNNRSIRATKDAVRSLLSSIIMVFCMSKQFSSSDRITSLFQRVSNQLISCCLKGILGDDENKSLWDRDRLNLVKLMEDCVNLNEVYQQEFRQQRQYLEEDPNKPNLVINESAAFGKLDLFVRRLIKLIDLFTTIEQFQSFREKNVEGLDDLFLTYDAYVTWIYEKKHPLLDFMDDEFDKDYERFSVKVADMETSLRYYLNQHLKDVKSIEGKMELIIKFEPFVVRPQLRQEIHDKVKLFFDEYGLLLLDVQDSYESYKNEPPIPRDTPPVAGRVSWSRQLLRRIEAPMSYFERYLSILEGPVTKRIINIYNTTAKTLVAYEQLWLQEWQNQALESQKLLGEPILRQDEATHVLEVNFPSEVTQLLAEIKHLMRLQVDIPSSLKIVFYQEDRLKQAYNNLHVLLCTKDELMQRIPDSVIDAFAPLLVRLQVLLAPGLSTLTWRSLNVETFIDEAKRYIHRLSFRVSKCVDVVRNRVDRNLITISRIPYFQQPKASVSLQELCSSLYKDIDDAHQFLMQKSVEVETGLDDMLTDIASLVIEDVRSIKIAFNEAEKRSALQKFSNRLADIKKSFYDNFYLAVRNSIVSSLDVVRERVTAHSRKNRSEDSRLVPLICADVVVKDDTTTIEPGLEEIQTTIKMTTRYLLHGTRWIPEWKTSSSLTENNRWKPPLLISQHCLSGRETRSITFDLDSGVGETEGFAPARTEPHADRQRRIFSFFRLPSVRDFVFEEDECAKKLAASHPRHSKESMSPSHFVFDRLSQDKLIIKMILLLTGLFYGSSRRSRDLEEEMMQFRWIWNKSQREELKTKLKDGHRALAPETAQSQGAGISESTSQRDIKAAMSKLSELDLTISRVENVYSNYDIGALTVNTKNFKAFLKDEITEWKVLYADFVRSLLNSEVSSMFTYIKSCSSILSMKVDNLSDLARLFEGIEDIRRHESTFGGMLQPFLSTLHELKTRMGVEYDVEEEFDRVNEVKQQWSKMISREKNLTHRLCDKETLYFAMFVGERREVDDDWNKFCHEIEDHKLFEVATNATYDLAFFLTKEVDMYLSEMNSKLEAMEQREKNIEIAGKLFGFKRQTESRVSRAVKQLKVWNDLWEFASTLNQSFNNFNKLSWKDAANQLNTFTSTVNAFTERSKEFPEIAKDLALFQTVMNNLRLYDRVLSVLQQLNVKYLRSRHWAKISNLVGVDLPLEDLEFSVSALIAERTVSAKPEIEDVVTIAEKEYNVETKLADMEEYWEQVSIPFSIWSTYDLPLIEGASALLEQLEDGLLTLQAFNRMNSAIPFETRINDLLSKLSTASDTFQLWLRVQAMWLSLEPVFASGEITSQIPVEAKRFSKLNKQWKSLMSQLKTNTKLLFFCLDNATEQYLRTLLTGLQKCQNSLQMYLDRKRVAFPRFYFLSDNSLIQVLSCGHHVKAIVRPLTEMFPGLSFVKTCRNKKNSIQVHCMGHQIGNQQEEVELLYPVALHQSAENWLVGLETAMQETMKHIFSEIAHDFSTKPLGETVKSYPAQACNLGVKLLWAAETAFAINSSYKSRNNFSPFAKTLLDMLEKLSKWCTQAETGSMVRTKIESLIISVLHHRDMFEQVVSAERRGILTSTGDFEWIKHMRAQWLSPVGNEQHQSNTFGNAQNMSHFWGGIRDSSVFTTAQKYTNLNEPENVNDFLGTGRLEVSVCEATFLSSYEYLGVSTRLVITPLTNRAFMAMLHALHWKYGGAPSGPAGTGKTETVKELGQALSTAVHVTNCSPSMMHEDLSRLFKGMTATRTWLCLDEFNRLTSDTLSGTSALIHAIAVARRSRSQIVHFPDTKLSLPPDATPGYFITLNPGYSGRQDLPESVKRHFRSFAMMQPDKEIILRIKLCSQGFQKFTLMAQKCCRVFELAKGHLSQQRHYDFGLRGLLAMLPLALHYKETLGLEEMVAISRAILTINLSRLDKFDSGIFQALVSDIFTEQTSESEYLLSSNDTGERASRIVSVSLKGKRKEKLQSLQSVMLSRHGVLVLGEPRVGKSSIIYTAAVETIERTKKPLRLWKMNPKGVNPIDMFGYINEQSNEWINGIFSVALDKYTSRECATTWFVLDGPIDSTWVESMNSLLDDNRTLVLSNGERIKIRDDTKICFEASSVVNASPATVSRLGILYLQQESFDAMTLLDAWCTRCDTGIGNGKRLADMTYALYEKYIGGTKFQRTATSSFLQEKLLNNTTVQNIEDTEDTLFSIMMKNVLSPDQQFSEVRFIELVLQLYTANLKEYGLVECPCDDDILSQGMSESKSVAPLHSNASHRRFLPNHILASDKVNWQDSRTEELIHRLLVLSMAHVVNSFLDNKAMTIYNDWMSTLGAPLPASSEAIHSYLHVDTSWKQFSGRRGSPRPSYKPLVDFYAMEWKSYCQTLSKWQNSLAANIDRSVPEDWNPVCADPGVYFMPTKETLRISYLQSILYILRIPFIIKGPRGMGKSSVARYLQKDAAAETSNDISCSSVKMGLPRRLPFGLVSQRLHEDNLRDDFRNYFDLININAAPSKCTHIVLDRGVTTAQFREKLHSNLARLGGRAYGPAADVGTIFIEDLYVCAADSWGDKPIQELCRQFVETDSLPYTDYDSRGDTIWYDKIHAVATGNEVSQQEAFDLFFPIKLRPPSAEDIKSIFWGFYMLLDLTRPEAEIFADKFSAKALNQLLSTEEQKLPIVPLAHCCGAMLQVVYNMNEMEKKSPGLIFLRFYDEVRGHVLDKSSFARLKQHLKESVDAFARDTPTRSSNDKCCNSLGSMQEQLDFAFHAFEETDEAFGSWTFSNIMDYDQPPRHVNLWLKENHDSRNVEEFLLNSWTQKMSSSKDQLSQNMYFFSSFLRNVLDLFRSIQKPGTVILFSGNACSGRSSALSAVSQATGATVKTVDSSTTEAQFFDELQEALMLTGGPANRRVIFTVYLQNSDEMEFVTTLNNLVRTHDVRSIFSKDQLNGILNELSDLGTLGSEDDKEELMAAMVQQIKENFSLVLIPASSEEGYSLDSFNNDYPALTHRSDHLGFPLWPEEALFRIAKGKLKCHPLDKQFLHVYAQCLTVPHMFANKMTLGTEDKFHGNAFIRFLRTTTSLISSKSSQLDTKLGELQNGFDKVTAAAKELESMQSEVAKQKQVVEEKDRDCQSMLKELNTRTEEAQQEKDRVEKIRHSCEEQRRQVGAERQVAEKDLQEARPYLDAALEAIEDIHSSDITELKAMSNPQTIIRLVFDCLLILKMKPLHSVEPTMLKLGSRKDRIEVAFLKDSYNLAWKQLLLDLNLIPSLKSFAKREKDNINEETIELLLPYLELRGMDIHHAKYSSKAVAGLLQWVKAMTQYHMTSKVVKPKLAALGLAESRLEEAEDSLGKAREEETECTTKLQKLQQDYDSKVAEQKRVLQHSQALKAKLNYASQLIDQLGDEKTRWKTQIMRISEERWNIYVDCLLSAALLCYSGCMDLNEQCKLFQEVLDTLGKYSLATSFFRYVPVGQTKENQVSAGIFAFMEQFLCLKHSSIPKLQIDGVMENRKFLQNAVLATVNSEINIQPVLLIDPQNSCGQWLRNHVKRVSNSLQRAVVELSASSPSYFETLERGIENGNILLLFNAELNIIRKLRPFLKGCFIERGNSWYVSLPWTSHHTLVDLSVRTFVVMNAFKTEIPGETKSVCVCVDFTMDMEALEEQVLSMISYQEQAALEEQLKEKTEVVLSERKKLNDLEQELLTRLSSQEGDILEDENLIRILYDVKWSSKATQANMEQASHTRERIRQRREVYRIVARRAKSLYMAIVGAGNVSQFYILSIDKFLQLLKTASQSAAHSAHTPRRLTSIIETITTKICRSFTGQLFNEHISSFYCSLAVTLLKDQEVIDSSALRWLTISLNYDTTVMSKQFKWLPDEILRNIQRISKELTVFQDLQETMVAEEKQWKRWYESSDPELHDIPDMQRLLNRAGHAGPVYRLILTKLFFPNRLEGAIGRFIKEFEDVPVHSSLQHACSLEKVPGWSAISLAWNNSFLESFYDALDDTSPRDPILVLHHAGTDIYGLVDRCAKTRKAPSFNVLSVGSVSDYHIINSILRLSATGGWVLVENVHINPKLLQQIWETLDNGNVHEHFRVFMSSLPQALYDTSIIRKCRIVAASEQKGIKHRMKHLLKELGYEAVERVSSPHWVPLLYTLCYFQANALERSNWGGWCSAINIGVQDLHCAIYEADKFSNGIETNWRAFKYMLNEVIYGGKMTDTYDLRLIKTMIDSWFPVGNTNSFAVVDDTNVSSAYSCPQHNVSSLEGMIDFADSLPDTDLPGCFGLPEGVMFDLKEKSSITVQKLLQEMTHSVTSGHAHTSASRHADTGTQETLLQMVDNITERIPAEIPDNLIDEKIERQGGPDLPLNKFLLREISKLNSLLKVVQSSLGRLRELVDGGHVNHSSVKDLSRNCVPREWIKNSDESIISWLHPQDVNGWLRTLFARHQQLWKWIKNGRPKSYWLPGFFAKRSFLIAVKQEMLREWRIPNLSLNDVQSRITPQNATSLEELKKGAPAGSGVFIHDLSLKGAYWDHNTQSLQKLGNGPIVSSVPVLHYRVECNPQSRSTESEFKCPVYEYEERGDDNLIDTFRLKTIKHDPSQFVLSGTALLCTTELS